MQQRQKIRAQDVSVRVTGLDGIDLVFSGRNAQELILELAHRVLDVEYELKKIKKQLSLR